MKILKGTETVNVYLDMARPIFDAGLSMGIVWEDYVDFVTECSLMEVNDEHFLNAAGKFKNKTEGVTFILCHGYQTSLVAKKYSIPVNSGIAAAVMPNQLGLKLIIVDVDYFTGECDTGELILAHELVHIAQLSRGDLIFTEDSGIEWAGWSPTVISLTECRDSFVAHQSVKDLMSNEILTKPWECEAYALTTPVDAWDDLFTEEAVEYMLTNMRNFM